MVLLIGLQLGQLLRLGVYIDFEDHQTHTVGTLRTARLCAEEVQVVHFEEADARHDTEGLVPFGISQCIYTAQENITHRSQPPQAETRIHTSGFISHSNSYLLSSSSDGHYMIQSYNPGDRTDTHQVLLRKTPPTPRKAFVRASNPTDALQGTPLTPCERKAER
jgi:hypothetical protein